jgi:hypothetical protein
VIHALRMFGLGLLAGIAVLVALALWWPGPH